jgi:hypothetical protein
MLALLLSSGRDHLLSGIHFMNRIALGLRSQVTCGLRVFKTITSVLIHDDLPVWIIYETH